ncbi:MAG: arsenic resistance N-acetyltransferase ArsN2 [Kofleriaceae bacterium]
MIIAINPTAPVDMSCVRSLLAASDLPIDDIDDPMIALFGAFVGPSIVGVIGLQACGDLGLLRSLAVAAEHRGRGIARVLCVHVIEQARVRPMTSLWLLTTSARDYFARYAFEAVPRDQAPDAIRATAQFASLCPSSACVMRRR